MSVTALQGQQIEFLKEQVQNKDKTIFFLQEQVLISESLERLASFGVDVGTQPHRDRSLPPRRVL